MSSLHRATPTAHRAANAPAGARAASARQFQDDPAIARLLSQTRAQLGGAWELICLWRRRQRDRAILRSLTTRQILDFCPSEAEAEEEMNKPFWRA